MKILVVKLADIGDAIGTIPALRALRAAYPHAQIDALVTPGGALEVLAGEPAVSGVRVLAKGAFDSLRGATNPRALATLARFGAGLRQERYDAVIFLHHLTTAAGAAKYRALALATGAPIRAGLDNGRGDWLTHRAADYGFGTMPEWAYWLSVVAALGVAPPADPRPTITPSPEGYARARALVPGDAPYVALHPGVGAFAPARQWPPERLAAVGKGLHAGGYRLVVTGGPDEAARAASVALRAHLGDTPVLDLTGKADISTTAAAYAAAALWVGSDNGAAHLAAAVGARSVVVFGPSNAAAWSPYGSVEWHPGDDLALLPHGVRTVVVRDPVPCSPCFYTGFTLGRPQGCPSRTCVAGVGGADVLAVGRALIYSGI